MAPLAHRRPLDPVVSDPIPVGRVERFRALYVATHPDVVAYCRRRIPPAAVDDVVADTFLITWQRLDDVHGDPRPWVFGVARNVIRNRRRAFARGDRLHETLAGELGTRAAEEGVIAHDEIDALIAALHALDEPDAELIRLAAWEGLPHSGIAVVLGCSENAVAIRLHRARKRLRARLERDPRWPAEPASAALKGSSVSAQVLLDGPPPHDGTGTTR